MQILRNISELERFSTVLYDFVRFPTVSYDSKGRHIQSDNIFSNTYNKGWQPKKFDKAFIKVFFNDVEKIKISYSMQTKFLNLGLFRLPMSLSFFKCEFYVVEHVSGSGFYKYLLDLDS